MKRLSWFYGLLIVMAFVGAGFWVQNSISKYHKTVQVWVAKTELQVDFPIKKSDLKPMVYAVEDVPSDAVTDPNKVDGLIAATTILKDQVVQNGALADGKTLREVVRRYGLNYGGLVIPVDQTDFGADAIHPGDTIDLIGISAKNSAGGSTIESKYVAETVPVLNSYVDAKTGNPKVVIAVPQENGPDIAKDITSGKIRIMIDPRPFVQVNASATSETNHSVSASTAPAKH